ncbi:MAG: L,D-transpeptidase family protein [Sphingobacteriales bacterium]|nr:L,D-transpeptidase family protein [Sphingobacteriales bacterium]
MKSGKLNLIVFAIALSFFFSCKGGKNQELNVSVKNADTILPQKATYIPQVNLLHESSGIALDSNELTKFMKMYPAYQTQQKDLIALYRKNSYNYLWFDKNGLIEHGHQLYNLMTNLTSQGISDSIPYLSVLTNRLDNNDNNIDPETELLMSAGYLVYAKKTVGGIIDPAVAKTIDWNLPTKKLSYTDLLDSFLQAPHQANLKEKTNISQYFQLQSYLQKYREMEKKGGWKTIPTDPNKKTLKPGDSSFIIPLIKERLLFTEDLSYDNQSNLYDATLIAAIIRYKKRNGNKLDSTITASHIAEMNVSLSKRIEQIMVNMERCRWIPVIPADATYLFVNIPEYRLHYIKNGKTYFESDVVVGKPATKTVIFSGDMKYVVFSPYWYVPSSIISKEVKPGMARNKNYLANHRMEWNGGNVRQLPGPSNSLGLVKFIFPNSNNIYMHDSPAKSLFNEENRSFSHGCIRVAKPRDLAISILADDPNWNPEKIDLAMNAGKEQSYTLKKTLPVYIGYFTAWVDQEGLLNFRKDIYSRDDRLADLIRK